jgi:hypothetical protein
MSNHKKPAAEPAVESFVEEFLATSGMICRIIDHMARFHDAGHSHPDAPPIDVVLRGLLCDVLTPLTDKCGHSEIGIATAVLRNASERISEEILLVNPDMLDPDQV